MWSRKFAIRGCQFQLYDFFVQFTKTLRFKFALQIAPIAAGVGGFGEHLHHVNDRKPPRFYVPYAANLLFLKDDDFVVFH